MMKMVKKERIIISLTLIVLMLLVASANSLATEITPANNTNTNVGNVITASTDNNTNSNTNISATVGSNSTNNTSSNYNNSLSSNSLPKAGTGSASLILIVLAFVASAIYAYKKVTDYNL